MKVFVVIPAYNESKTIATVVRALKRAHYSNIVVVDDGSSDDTAERVRHEGAHVAQHLLNRGLGGALRTGISAALTLGANIIVTFDADGQHDPMDIASLIRPIQNNHYEVVIGSRLLQRGDMPFHRVILNRLANVATYFLFGVWTTDSQSGLRAFSRSVAQALNLKTQHMEVSSEIIREIGHHHFRFKEVPIRAIYTNYSLSKGQNFFLGLKTFFKLVFHRLTN